MTRHKTIESPGRYFIFCAAIILCIILADQISKWYVMESLLREKADFPDFIKWFKTVNKIALFAIDRDHFKTIPLGRILNLVMVWNQGVSFGLFDTTVPRMAYVFIGISLTISMFLLIWMALCNKVSTSIALAMIVGGAVGNVIDRIRFGAVADFLDFHIGEHHWPAFNIADTSIVIGALLLAAESFLKHDEEKPSQKDKVGKKR